MELRATREMRRREQLSGATGKRAAATAAPAKAQPAQKQAAADKVTLSRQALAFLEEQDQKMWRQAQEREQRRQGRMNDSLSALEGGRQDLDYLKNGLKVLEACRKIAASIMKGNRVPPQDLRFLMENDPEGYKLAMALRRENPDPEEEKSVLEKEDQTGAAKSPDSGGEVPGVSAAEALSGGGETSAAAE